MADIIDIKRDAAESVAPATSGLFAALAKAQASFTKIVKNRKAVHYKYADLEAILDAVRPALNAQGIYLYQEVGEAHDGVTCKTTLYYRDGSSLSGGTVRIPTAGMRVQSGAQAFGSAITYARRYSLCATLCVSAEDDDDGAAATEDDDDGAAATEAAADPAPAPKLAVDPGLKARAEAAANIGGEAYKALWKELSNTDRNALVKSGVHAALKAVMQENSHE